MHLENRPLPFIGWRSGTLWGLFILILLTSCQTEQETAGPYQEVEGETMGTYYRVKYSDAQERNFKASLDSILLSINQDVSTYIPTSLISRFNQSDTGVELEEDNRHFRINLIAAGEVVRNSEGAFDPTIMPLVNYWGFGYDEKRQVIAVDSARVDSLLVLVDFKLVEFDPQTGRLSKKRPGVQLDFSAIAKGYAVDELGRFLESKEVTNFFVDIGGEVVAKGSSPRGDAWRVGINVPQEDASPNAVQAVLQLSDRGMATSGNYRNFYEVDGVKYSHTISARTGFPERNRLLSASILAEDCIRADAYATACMAMGPEAAIQLVEQQSGLEGYFIISKEDGGMEVYYSKGIQELLVQAN